MRLITLTRGGMESLTFLLVYGLPAVLITGGPFSGGLFIPVIMMGKPTQAKPGRQPYPHARQRKYRPKET